MGRHLSYFYFLALANSAAISSRSYSQFQQDIYIQEYDGRPICRYCVQFCKILRVLIVIALIFIHTKGLQEFKFFYGLAFFFVALIVVNLMSVKLNFMMEGQQYSQVIKYLLCKYKASDLIPSTTKQENCIIIYTSISIFICWLIA